MTIFNVLSMIGGLSLFLYGMSAMGDGLAKMAGGKLEAILEKLTSKKIFAVLLGAGVTAIIQSSSATTVMVVGFVNSGIMKLTQAVGIIMGANVGTTITSWMLSLTGTEGSNLWIQLLKPTSFSPILAVLVGAVLTAIIQSSSASVGILQALCSTGAVSYSAALPIMGQNIGTCITSIISSVGAKKNAKRAAAIHLFFNVIGTTLFMIVFYSLNRIVSFAFLSDSANAAGIAVIHSLFNIGCCIILYPFSNLLVKLATIVIPDGIEEKEEQDDKEMLALDDRFLESPAFAMEICRNASRQMAIETMDAITLALEVANEYDKKKAAKVYKLEEKVDHYEDKLGSYLVRLSSKNLSKSDSESLSVMLHGMSDFEKISDHAINIVESAKEMNDRKLVFSKKAKFEMESITRAVHDIVVKTVDVFNSENVDEAIHIEPLEDVIDGLTKDIKQNHVRRLTKGKCTIELGVILEDVLTNLERVSDHCSNVAVEMVAIHDGGYDTHEIFNSMSKYSTVRLKVF